MWKFVAEACEGSGQQLLPIEFSKVGAVKGTASEPQTRLHSSKRAWCNPIVINLLSDGRIPWVEEHRTICAAFE